AVHETRTGHQPQDCEEARSRRSFVFAGARRRGDRMKRREFITLLGGAPTGQSARTLCPGISARISLLDIALGGLPAKMRVEADAGTGVFAKTVGELRKMTTWSENLVITTPQGRYPESAVKISKASVATRTSPKR